MTYSLLKQEMLFDNQTRFREQTKSKWKIMIELLAAFNYVYVTEEFTEHRFSLLKEHQKVMLSVNAGEDANLYVAFEIYQQIYPNGCKQETFEESFLKLTGYTIDVDGNTVSLNRLVDSFVCSLCGGDTAMEQMLKIDYCESQMLSHANGYMWFANKGAWEDIYNIFWLSDVGMVYILSAIKALFEQMRKEEGITRYKPIENVLRNGIRDLKPQTEKMMQLLQIPATGLS